MKQPTALPTKRDVLIGTRYQDSKRLNNHNDWLSFHPGNAQWLQLVDDNRHFFCSSSQKWLQQAISSKLVQQVKGRFLLQNRYGDWEVKDNIFAMEQTSMELAHASKRHARVLVRELWARQVYGMGKHWNTRMQQVHTPKLLENLERQLFGFPQKRKKQIENMSTFSATSNSTQSAWFLVTRDIPDVNPTVRKKAVSFEEASRYSIGNVVESNAWNGLDWFTVEIIDVVDEDVYDIRFVEDDWIEHEVFLESLRPLIRTFTTGDRVRASDVQKNEVRGTVKRVAADSSMDIYFELHN
eukprot:CAMPEP_0118680418 /NCGR_PEP_ID=MMETSP0800-20121206/4355_1 /TAXON_ID=210618 ORGANISM="Striatella unipunctata, Strain CCMP2910" /NCGR_SAMPLE_ID=MMETSP0800 /ASSEMBLY_ACC=CAM_ASM_000638 /LENGTH=296 /DNA_ID=CAMNT_0006576567 /DNA_START=1 /DNA_END=888 /DNA_ORIENTATION=+